MGWIVENQELNGKKRRQRVPFQTPPAGGRRIVPASGRVNGPGKSGSDGARPSGATEMGRKHLPRKWFLCVDAGGDEGFLRIFRGRKKRLEKFRADREKRGRPGLAPAGKARLPAGFCDANGSGRTALPPSSTSREVPFSIAGADRASHAERRFLVSRHRGPAPPSGGDRGRSLRASERGERR